MRHRTRVQLEPRGPWVHNREPHPLATCVPTRYDDEDRLEIHPGDAESRGVADSESVGIRSRAGETVMRADVTARVSRGVVYTTFHFPESGANLVTTENSGWATNGPEYKVTAVAQAANHLRKF